MLNRRSGAAVAFTVAICASCGADRPQSICELDSNVPAGTVVLSARLVVDHQHGHVLLDGACPRVAFDVIPWDKSVSEEFFRDSMIGLPNARYQVEISGRIGSPEREDGRPVFTIEHVLQYKPLEIGSPDD